jgi:hypothetical protein
MPAKRKRAKRFRPDPDYFRPQREAQLRGRRALCSLLSFWRACGDKECLRARACARASNDCFAQLWPLVPEQLKVSIRAGIEAKTAGLPPPEIAAAIVRAQARWRRTQTPPTPAETAMDTSSPAPPSAETAATPPRRVAAPAPSGPRLRML